MRLEDLNWMDVEKYLEHDDRLMLILGACEQHGYLSLLADARIPLALADAASQQTGVLVAPALNFGSSPYFLGFPGTLSLRQATLLDAVADLVHSAHHQGFHRMLVLNGHGGNDGARGRLAEVANELPGIRLAWYAWWTSNSVVAVAERHQIKPAHANWLEAFPFTMVSELPKGEKIPPRIPGILNSDEARRLFEDGSFGGQYQVGEAIMQEIFEAALRDILQLLKFE